MSYNQYHYPTTKDSQYKLSRGSQHSSSSPHDPLSHTHAQGRNLNRSHSAKGNPSLRPGTSMSLFEDSGYSMTSPIAPRGVHSAPASISLPTIQAGYSSPIAAVGQSNYAYGLSSASPLINTGQVPHSPPHLQSSHHRVQPTAGWPSPSSYSVPVYADPSMSNPYDPYYSQLLQSQPQSQSQLPSTSTASAQTVSSSAQQYPRDVTADIASLPDPIRASVHTATHHAQHGQFIPKQLVKTMVVKRVHRGEERFGCALCSSCDGKKRGDQVYAHLWAHFGQQPFRCEECNVTFSAKGSFQRHQLQHGAATQDNGHTCPKCLKVINRQDNLERHKRKCTGSQGVESSTRTLVTSARESRRRSTSVTSSDSDTSMTYPHSDFLDFTQPNPGPSNYAYPAQPHIPTSVAHPHHNPNQQLLHPAFQQLQNQQAIQPPTNPIPIQDPYQQFFMTGTQYDQSMYPPRPSSNPTWPQWPFNPGQP